MDALRTAESLPASSSRFPTWLGYLLGRRDAILAVAREPRYIWIGLLFVLSAGLAREYDGECLVAEPWYALVPVAVSLPMSLVLWAILYIAAIRRGWERLAFWRYYAAFLALYWMTAPLAWLYGIPYERFYDARDATSANLWTLDIVSVWRVLLIARAASVLLGGRFIAALCPVMFFASAATLIAIWNVPIPMMAIMGGVRLSAAERMIGVATMNAKMLAMLSLPIWLATTALVAFGSTFGRDVVTLDAPRESVRRTFAFALVVLIFWLCIVPFTQPEQRLRFQVERALMAGAYDEALTTLAANPRDAFPPHWEPPPKWWIDPQRPPVLDVFERALEFGAPQWVMESYAARAAEMLSSAIWMRETDGHFLSRAARLAELSPQFRDLLRPQTDELKRWARDDTLTPELRESLVTLTQSLQPAASTPATLQTQPEPEH